MDHQFRLLNVTLTGSKATAVLPLSHVLGAELTDALRHDCRQLAQTDRASVELDLRGVHFTDGSFFVRLLELRRGLAERSVGLTLLPSANIADVMRFTRLDQVFGLSELAGIPE